MVFVYPCITSENVNRQIVPAASKSMELFFLYQLQGAFNDGVITCKQEYDRSRHIPGAITFESVNKTTKSETLLEKSFDALENVKMIIKEDKVLYKNDYRQPRVSVNDNIHEIIKESQNIEEKLHTYRIQLNSILEESKNENLKVSAKKVLESVNSGIKAEHKFRTVLEATGGAATAANPLTGIATAIGNAISSGAKDDKKKGKSENYKKSDDYKIDLTPTSMPLEVDVEVEDQNGGKKWMRKTITVGVKVMPIQIKNFNVVGDALLDDYFSRVSDGIFKTIYRNTARTIMGKFKGLLSSIGLDKLIPDTDTMTAKNGDDIVKQMITLAPSNFVNASAFRSNSNAPLNYKFTSSVVMFNKDDIDEDDSIFRNRAAMNRLFKMGWTSFAVLDPVKEVMMFISSLDGGFLHILPYSYLFNTLNANDIYKNESALRNGSRPFSIRKGNFATFARSI